MKMQTFTTPLAILIGLFLLLTDSDSFPGTAEADKWKLTQWKGVIVYNRTYRHRESFAGGRSLYDYKNDNTENLHVRIEFTVNGPYGGSTRTPSLDILYSEDRVLHCEWQRPYVLCCPEGEWRDHSCKNPERKTPGDHGKQDYAMTTRGSEGDGYVELNVTPEGSFVLRTRGSVSYVGAETGEEWIYDVCRGRKTNEHKRNKLHSGQANWLVRVKGDFSGNVIQGYKVLDKWSQEFKRIPSKCNCLFGCFLPKQLEEGKKERLETVSWHIYKNCQNCSIPLIFPRIGRRARGLGNSWTCGPCFINQYRTPSSTGALWCRYEGQL